MSTDKNIRALRGSARFAGATDKDVGLQAFLESDKRNLIEGDRNLVLNVVDQFNFERDYSSTYRMYGKIDVLYQNIIMKVQPVLRNIGLIGMILTFW